MSFDIRYDAASHCVLANLIGPLNVAVVSAFFTQLGSVAKQHRCARILTDLRGAYIAATATEIYAQAQLLTERQILKSQRRALVIAQDEVDYRFWENLCVNRGFDQVKVFTDYEVARQWVLSSGDIE